MNEPTSVLAALMQVLADRRGTSPEASYVARLYQAGPEQISGKIAEEAGELIDATAETELSKRAHVVHEAADLLFHTLVLVSWAGVSLSEVETELSKRFGTSGLDEAARRASN